MVIKMTVRESGNLIQQPKDEFGFSDRDIHWIWNTYRLYETNFTVQHSATQQKREIIKNFINSHPNRVYILSGLSTQKDSQLVNESEFKWINKNDHRLLIILINILTRENHLNLSPTTITNNYDYFISAFDNLLLSKDIKLNNLNRLKFIWSNFENNKNTTKWINVFDPEQISWAWDYLKKTNYLAYTPVPPITFTTRYEYILASLDLIEHFNNPATKELFLLKMKKTWAQKKYRDSGKIKKPHHLPLTRESHEQLKELSVVLNKPFSTVLEFIIEKSYKEYMLNNEGKNKF